MSKMGDKPILLKVIHAFSPTNNDELKLDKGDVITVTQKEEGGWWEGTLSGKTGWFPSNYVEDYVPPALSGAETANGKKASVHVVDTALTAQQAEYRRIVLADLIESETAYLADLQGMFDNFLQPLGKSDLLTHTEYKILIGNLPDVIQCHTTSLLNSLKTEQAKPPKEQRVGKIFLEIAPRMESFHKTYCGNHPKAVQVVEKHKEELAAFIEGKGGRSPGVLVLIVALSQPFRRLEKYPAMLQELERHVEEFHKDRGDLQRSIEYYKQIDKSCCALRKQKEMELEVLSGAIKDWEGSDVAQLGEILFMNMVYIGYDRQPRYFVLFPNTLLILSYNPENNSLVYEGKIPVSGITLTPLADKDSLTNSFEIAGPMIDQIIVSCSSKQSKDTWLQHLNKILKSNRFPSFGSSPQQVQTFFLQKTTYNAQLSRPEKYTQTSRSDSIISSGNNENEYLPSKTPPYVELVEYFRNLYQAGKIQSKSVEVIELLGIDPYILESKKRQQKDGSSSGNGPPALDKPKRRKFLTVNPCGGLGGGGGSPKLEVSCDSDCSSKSSRGSPYERDDQDLLENLSPLSPVADNFRKWRWGMSNLCVEKLKSPSKFLSTPSREEPLERKGVNIDSCLETERSRSVTFGDSKLYWNMKGTISSFLNRTQSLPVIKFTFEESNYNDDPMTTPSGNGVRQEGFVRGRLVRQDAFDFGGEEDLPDENQNFNFRDNSMASTDSGLGEFSSSSRTTQINFYEEITFEISNNSSEGEPGASSSTNPDGSFDISNTSTFYRSNLYAHWLLKFESSP